MKAHLKKNTAFFLACFFMILAFLFYSSFLSPSKEKEGQHFQKQFIRNIKALKTEVGNFVSVIPTSNNENEAWESKKIDFRYAAAYFVYHHDSLRFWTDNSVPVPLNLSNIDLSKKIVQLKNAWYYQYVTKHKDFTITAYFLIKHDFPYENERLQNVFSDNFSMRLNASILNNQSGDYSIFDEKGQFLFSLKWTNSFPISQTVQICFFALICLTLCLLFYAYLLFVSNCISNKKAYLLEFLGLICLLVLVKYSADFSLFQQFDLFQPQLFASSKLLPTLANLFLSVLLVCTFIYFTLSKQGLTENTKNKRFSKTIEFFFPTLFFGFSLVVIYIVRSLLVDSSIDLFIHEFASLSLYAYVVLLLLVFLFIAYFLCGQFIVRQTLRFPFNKSLPLTWSINAGLFLTYLLIQKNQYWPNWLFPFLFLALLGFVYQKRKGIFSFSYVLMTIGLFVLFSLSNFYHYQILKEKNTREVYAQQLIEEQDPMTEIEYTHIADSIAHSSYLKTIIQTKQNYNVSELKAALEKRFFNRYWERYELDFYLFNADSIALVNYSANDEGNYEYFSKMIANDCTPSTLSKCVYFVKNYTDKISYLIRQPLLDGDSTYGFLICALKSKKIPKEIGFPRLLISNQSKVFLELEEYSLAKYINGKLAFRYGEFNYPLSSQALKKELGKQQGFTEYKSYSHFIYSDNHQHLIVLSKQGLNTANYLTAFSFLFVFFACCTVILFLLFQPKEIRFHQLNLAFKIQLVLIALVFVTLLLFGWGAGSFVSQQYSDYSTRLIREKIYSVSKDLQQKNGIETEIHSGKPSNYLDNTLQRFSDIFYTDINLYGLNGELISSSRPAIYKIGLLSSHIDPWAYRMLKYRNKSEIIHEENIGDLYYLSAYIPFLNKDQNVVAYLNLQYFAHQNQLENELTSFLTAIINAFVLLLATTVIISIFVTNWITAPLKLIQKSVVAFTLGEKYKPIKYTGKDEIGSLVAEYNKKLIELEDTAKELARSERESAWREMAKQVAHEIKNPLTPMKLSLQHLQRTFDQSDKHAKEQLMRVSASIIEQIDALSKIANEFSSFAKLPKPNEELIDLIPLIEHVIEVFKHGGETAQVELKTEEKNCAIMGDKDLMIRVFNNLIKNALQAIPENRAAKIKIDVKVAFNTYLIAVSDNGTGISEEMKDKIFVPNFTTKTTGTGLGLAMVKQIITSHKGKIWFETSSNKGTTFFIEIHKHERIK